MQGEAVRTDEHGRQRDVLGDADLRAAIGILPSGWLVAFPGLVIDHATLAGVTRSATP